MQCYENRKKSLNIFSKSLILYYEFYETTFESCDIYASNFPLFYIRRKKLSEVSQGIDGTSREILYKK